MKKIIGCLLLMAAFAASCQKNYDLNALSAVVVPTPTSTPMFNQCSLASILSQNPWNHLNYAAALPPAYSGNANITVRIFDSNYTKVKQVLFVNDPSSTILLIDAVDQNGVALSPGNYYMNLGVTVTASGGTSVCYYEPITIN